ncbi:MAG: NFACT family protein [Candidatus Manganitrophaceae bacterium]
MRALRGRLHPASPVEGATQAPAFRRSRVRLAQAFKTGQTVSLGAKQIGEILTEIVEPLQGGVIHKIDQPRPERIVFEIHRGRERHHLLLSAHRRFSRIHLTTQKHPNPTSPPRFCQLLRAHLRWKRIVSLDQIGGDRIVQMTCAWTVTPETEEIPDLEKRDGTVSLIAELMGPASNIYLINQAENISGFLFPPSGGRPLQVGHPYQPPPLHPTGAFKETAIPLVEPGPLRFNRSVEAFYHPLEEKTSEEEETKRLLAVVDEKIGRARKKLRQLSVGLAEAEKADRYRAQGELLKTHLHQIRSGMKEIQIADPAHPEKEPFSLSLDPSLAPSENLALFFKRYKKAQAARTAITVEVGKTEVVLKELEQQRQILLEGGTIAIEGKPLVPTRREKEKRGGPPTFLSADGWTLTVGRNGRENDEITFRMARGNDLWFHARGVPGSHLIARGERGKEIPYQTLLDAATLSLHFSDARKEGKGDVTYTHRKYVQKPKRGKPGAVFITQEKNIYIEIDPGRLERLFACAT